jgi:hypothetical protein
MLLAVADDTLSINPDSSHNCSAWKIKLVDFLPKKLIFNHVQPKNIIQTLLEHLQIKFST